MEVSNKAWPKLAIFKIMEIQTILRETKGGQERKTYGEGSTTLLTFRNVCEGLLLE